MQKLESRELLSIDGGFATFAVALATATNALLAAWIGYQAAKELR